MTNKQRSDERSRQNVKTEAANAVEAKRDKLKRDLKLAAYSAATGAAFVAGFLPGNAR